jgi:peptide-methionine (S)-S-oxide reductase
MTTSHRIGWLTTSTALLLGLLTLNSALAGNPRRIPAPVLDKENAAAPLQTAVLAGGCFWGVQGVFQHVRGVLSVVSGYAGGDKSTAHYHMVSTGTTGHAEAVEIKFDSQVISYADILHIFFAVVHDPTELNRQGPDIGPQYRSAIFYASETQADIARAYIAQLEKAHVFPRPIETRVDALRGFYPAEDAHQDFLIKYPDSPYIVINDLPKISALKTSFPEYYRDQPVRVTASAIAVTVSGSTTP